MKKALKTIEISHIPALVKIVNKVNATGEPRVLRRNRKNMAILKPLRFSRGSRSRGKRFTSEDALWNIVGIGRSGVTDVSENKHKYLAEAYSSKA